MNAHPAIVIIGFNRPKSIERLLKYLLLGRYPDQEITLVISVVNKHGKSRSVSRHRPLQHLQIPVGISKRCERAAADVLMDTDWFACLVVYEIHFWQSNQSRFAVAGLEFCLDATANHLFGRNTVNGFSPWTHKLNPTP